MIEIQAGSTITNGTSAIRVTERSHGTQPGWLGIYISLASGAMTGTPAMLPDDRLQGWDHVPFEWRPSDRGNEERYVWSADCRHLDHQVQRIGEHRWQ